MAGDGVSPRFPRSSSHWRLGVLVSLSVGLALLLLVWTGPLSVRGGERFAVDFGYIGPLKPGAAVRISGVVVGVVDEVEFLGGQDHSAGAEVMVRVHLRMEERARAVMTDRAQIYVTTLGVLGEHYVDVRPLPGGTSPGPGASLRGIDLARADLLLPRAAALLESMNDLWREGEPSVRAALDLLRTLAAVARRAESLLTASSGADGASADGVEAAWDDVRAILEALRAALGDGARLRELLRGIEAMSAQGQRLVHAIEPTDLQAMARAGQGALSGAERALTAYLKGPLGAPEQQAALLQSLEQTLTRMDQLAGRADRLLGELEAGRGAAGRAFHDEAMLEDLKAVLRGLRATPLGRMGE